MALHINDLQASSRNHLTVELGEHIFQSYAEATLEPWCPIPERETGGMLRTVLE